MKNGDVAHEGVGSREGAGWDPIGYLSVMSMGDSSLTLPLSEEQSVD